MGVQKKEADEHSENVVMDHVSSDSAAPTCPEASRRSTIEILLQQDQEAIKANVEDEKNMHVGDKSDDDIAKSLAKGTTIMESRGRRESALSAGSEVEL